MSDAFDEDTTEPESVTFDPGREFGEIELPEMADFLGDLGVTADEMDETLRFFELRVMGVEPALAALQVGWSLRKLRTKEADPFFGEVLSEIRRCTVESIESVLVGKAKAGTMDAIKMVLYNMAPERWKDVRRIVDERHDDPVEQVAASVTAGILDAVRILGVRDVQAALAAGPQVVEATVIDDADRDEQAELQAQANDHASKIALPSVLGRTIAHDMWTEEYLIDPWVLEIEAEIIEAVTNPDPDIRSFLRIHLPPQVGKTRYMTLLAFWILGTMPHTRIIFVTYSDDYSASRGREIRSMINAFGWMFGIELDPDTKSASDFKLKGHPGGVLAVGIGSQITGRSGDVIIIDDLLKNAQEAASKAAKDLHEEEFDRTLYPRLQPGGTMILTNTRWSEDDLAGRLEAREADPEYEGDRFKVLTFPAIAEMPEHDEVELTPDERAEWTDIIGRVEGEPLKCRYYRGGDWDKSIFYKVRATLLRTNPIGWASTYQQNPTSREGSMFPAKKWQRYHWGERPDMASLYRVWDLAASEGSGDWTVGSLVGRGYDGKMYVLDVTRDRLSPDDVLEKVRSTAAADGYSVAIRVEEERAGAGKTVTAFYKKALTGYNVDGVRAEGTKETRATPYSTLQQTGEILIPYDDEVPWDVQGFVDEHKQLMGDGRKPRYDDRIDTVAYAVNLLMVAGPVEAYEMSGGSAGIERQMMNLLMRHAS